MPSRTKPKTLDQNLSLDKEQASLFDNPLSKEFLHTDQIAIFLRKSEKWVKAMVMKGKLPCHPNGRDFIFYLPEIREAILANALSNQKENTHDSKKKTKRQNHSLPSERESGGFSSYRDFLN